MRILVPLDGTAFAELVVKPVAALAGHMAEPPHVMLLSVLTTPEVIGVEYGALVTGRRRYLERIKATLALPDECVETMVQYGDPTKMICAAGQQENVDIILMMGHCLPAYGNAVHFCTADEVVTRSSIPAIILSPNDTAFAGVSPSESLMVRVSQANPFQSAVVSSSAVFLAQMYSCSAVPSPIST